MGDFVVDLFLKNLNQHITSSKLGLIISEKNKLQSLEEEITYLRGFLKVTEKKRNDHSELMELVMQIKDLVSEAENIVELFVAYAYKVDHAHYSLREHQDRPILGFFQVMGERIQMFTKGMKTLTAEVKKIYDENRFDIKGVAVQQLIHSSIASGGGSGSSRGSHISKVVKKNRVVGFQEEVKRLMDKLDDRGEGKPLEIISIIGTGGGGKTTLAREVYDHPYTSHTFQIRAWIDVSQAYDKSRKRDLLIRILESATPQEKKDYEKSSDDKLGEDLLKCLKGKKYLIVMDDVWDTKAWNEIQISFPKEGKGSKVLFTSRQPVQLDSVGYVPHYLAPLSTNWCWELLQEKVFGMKCCRPELEDIGKQIAEKCAGLPLVVVTIAGILATENKTPDVWEKVAKHLSFIIAINQDDCMEILELSYNHLPLHLKSCFLYIGGYPEDNEIPVRELLWLWIAEGFIQRSEGGKSLEAIAKDYLTGLIDRSLVQVARKSHLGGIKTCRIHDLLRELCLKKVEGDKFFVKVDQDNYFSPSAMNEHCRLFIGRQFFERFSLRPRNLHSFLCLSSSQSKVETNLSFFVENFEFLRVLSFMSATCHGEIGIGHLVHLRYLAYTLYADELPFSYLWNLETLNLNVPTLDSLLDRRTIRLPCDIIKMVNLRHLYSKNGAFAFHLSGEEAGTIGFDPHSTLDSLQTLQHLCACKGCQSFLVRTPNLRKLGLYGGESTADNVLRFPNLEFLKCLETLTFAVDDTSHIFMKTTLLPELKLPRTITRITLKYTRLKWEELSLLATLPSLEVLRLLKLACRGRVWNMSELEGFPQLKYLRFNNLKIEEWNASEDQFPKLEVLVLEYCRNLEQIPADFAYLNELREIKLKVCRRTVEESAREILEGQRYRLGDDDFLNLLAKDILPY